ncbi:PREDICTED: carnosine N-methyltransferase-like [Amphimedon queenslandica]|uniref:carnosine N-methyltransferase n=1 Tax=Amphimedon queenslandica TaxID=400682 RepID=A0A1X7TM47_AMPQE|nr:PREDICTED: carnosine N-methyltransferase-like [Amphimedon queenslandica]|eukprot:XP_019858904.1 PREDICTED: carnosine N-methyltransferase-like [Amphimedon queenslandica]
MAASSEDWSEEELRLEKEHFKKIVNAYLYYKAYGYLQIEKMKKNYHLLPERHKDLLKDYPSHIEKCKEAIDANFEFIKGVVSNAIGFLNNSDVSDFSWEDAQCQVVPATCFDMEKVVTTIKQFYRDWSKEGEKERELCYDPIITQLKKYFPPSDCDVSSVKVLVPGSGLGRLAFDIAHLGYCCEGNEFSMYMLLASNFMLNKNDGTELHTVHPWALKTCNNLEYSHQLSSIKIPDVNPSELPQYGLFSMSAGDFLQVYTEKDQWDCIACCFFIDTAHNVIEYIENIYKILKPGGLWINFGPLLYHFADMPGETSLELSWEDIKRISCKIGFEIMTETLNCPSYYIQHPQSMIQLCYNSVLLVAKKPSPKLTTPE